MIFHLIVLAGIIALYLLLCAKQKNPKRELLFLRIVFFTFFILVATREMTIGNDTPMYLNLFEKCATEKWAIIKTSGYFESGYLTLNILISYISKDARFFMFVMSLILNYSCYRFIKRNSNNFLLSTLMYVCLLFFYTSMTMMRQFIAIAIIISGLDLAMNRKIIPFVFVALFATLFHSSAWVALFIIPIANLRFTRKRAIIASIIGIIAAFSMGTIFNNFAELIGRTNYYESRFGNESLGNLIYAIVYLSFYIFARYAIAKHNQAATPTRQESFYLYSLLAASIVSIMGVKMDIMSRVIIYFSIFSIVSIPNLLSNYIQTKTTRKILQFSFIIFLVIYSSAIIILRPEWNSAYRYKSCLAPKENYICKKA